VTDSASDISHVLAVILAGGLGTRLRSVVADRPKVLAEIHGRPFLSYLLDHLEAAGFRSALLCTGYLGEQIEQQFGTQFGSLRLSYSEEPRPLGTAGALRLALPLVNSNPVLVMNGDTFAAGDLCAFWQWRCSKQPRAAIMLSRVNDCRRYGSLTVDSDGAVLEFREKGKDVGPGWINAGVYFFAHEVIEMIPDNKPVSLEYDVFPKLVGRGLYAFPSEGRFLDIGTPEDFASAESFFSERVCR